MCSDSGRRRAWTGAAALALLAISGGCITRGCSGAASEQPAAAPEQRPASPASAEARSPVSANGKPEGAVVLQAARAGWSRLIPEQSALFDVTLRNGAGAPRQVTSLNDNTWTPVVRAYDASGQLLAEGSPRDLQERLAGHMGEPTEAPPATVTLGPGEEQPLPVELWHFMNPLRPGRYALEVVHTADPASATPVSSGRVPFEVIPAGVEACALGYESAQRLSTVLAWIAVPSDTSAPELFARASGSTHAAPQSAGRSFGAVPPGAAIAVGAAPPDAMTTWLGWVAVAAGGQVELHQHSLGAPAWRSGPIPLPVAGAVPVPRFPDRGHAVFLATGLAGGRPALTGVSARPKAPPPAAWTVPLAALPRRSACAFAATGAIAVILVSDDGATTRVARVDVDESGAVVSPERVLRTSPNEVLAVTVDQRPGAPQVVLLLESNRTQPNRVALVRLPLAGGAAAVVPFAPARGWPSVVAEGGERALRAREVALEVDWDGRPQLALVDELGRLFAGPLDGSPLGMIRDAARGPARCPHAGALREQTTFAGFAADGSLFFSPEGHGH
ncbi:uncharacterized protein SOCE26_049240 [Sorangium cellulosum]|uniref:Uncharacterized protein n=1 Tax=Sorangium cellulosum TaxID=56 RepID=A0A2L0EW42_SORCE|nr:hypothetical protein [Sorangium cellulosum]AUX43475.1 uncharacterized protein SOCE26_049240 [Sorangium cellulosum]